MTYTDKTFSLNYYIIPITWHEIKWDDTPTNEPHITIKSEYTCCTRLILTSRGRRNSTYRSFWTRISPCYHQEKSCINEWPIKVQSVTGQTWRRLHKSNEYRVIKNTLCVIPITLEAESPSFFIGETCSTRWTGTADKG